MLGAVTRDPEHGLTDEALRERLRDAKRSEEQLSYERRMLHGRIDVVRSEILARVDRGRGVEHLAGDLDDLVARLTEALTHKGPPPIEAELAEFGHADDGPGEVVSLDEAMPDITQMSDADLAGLVRSLSADERRTSALRQELHRTLDLLRAENVARLQKKYADDGS
jgi:hypothetical protein